MSARRALFSLSISILVLALLSVAPRALLAAPPQAEALRNGGSPPDPVFTWTQVDQGGFANTGALSYVGHGGEIWRSPDTGMSTLQCPSVLFSEDWESGIDLQKWLPYGEPRPSLYPGEGLYGSTAMDSNGDSNYDSGLIARTPLDITSGITVEFWLRGYGEAWSPHAGPQVGLSACPADGNNESCRDWVVDIEPCPQYMGVYLYSKAGQAWERWAPLDDTWHKYRFTVTPNGLVDFYRDDVLKFSTTTPLDLSTYGTLQLDVRGRSVASYWYLDNITAYSGTMGDGLPCVDAGGPYTVVEGGAVTLAATGSDLGSDSLTYAWDLDDDGSFETPGQTVNFSAQCLTAPAAKTVAVKVTDPGGFTATDEATIQIDDPSPWMVELVDGENWAANTSLAVDDLGRAHIVYLQAYEKLRYAVQTDGGWSIQTVYSASGPHVRHPSLALDSAGQPHIAFADLDLNTLYYAAQTVEGWQIEGVDMVAPGRDVQYTSLAMDSQGQPHIHYVDGPNPWDFQPGLLKYATKTGSGWTLETVTQTGTEGGYGTLALDSSGNPHIAFVYGGSNELYYASRTTSGWQVQFVDWSIGLEPALAFDKDDQAHIASHTYNPNFLYYTTQTPTGWSVQAILDGDPMSLSMDMALDEQDRPHLCAQFDGTSVMYLTKTEAGWSKELVDVGVGDCSLAVDTDGIVHMSLGGTQGLKYAARVLPAHAPPCVSVDVSQIAVQEGQTATNIVTVDSLGSSAVSLSASVGAATDNLDGTWSWSYATTDGPVDSQQVTITATNNEHAATQISFDLVVGNVGPTVYAGADAAINEGAPLPGHGSFTDPGGDTWAATVDYGDGSGVQPLPLNPDKTFALSHVYEDDGTYTVNVTVADDDGGVGSDQLVVQVHNVAPSVAADQSTVTVTEGQIAANAGAYSDHGADDVTITASVGMITQGDGTWQWAWATSDGPDESQDVTITADDGEGGASIATFHLAVLNAPPAVTTFGDQTAVEGAEAIFALGTLTDPGASDGPWSISVDWGDGASETFTVTGQGSLGSQQHTYAENGEYAVTVTASDKDSDSGRAWFGVSVGNAAPSDLMLRPSATRIDENDTLTLEGSFADPGTLDTHTVTIDWGDGSTDTTLNLAADELGFGPISHQYLDDDPTGTPSDDYAIVVTVADDDTGSASASTTLTVDNVAPSVGPISVPLEPVAVNAAVLVDAAWGDVGMRDTHTATWTWGDGSTSAGSVVEEHGSGAASGGHVYTGAGVYTVQLTVTDDDTGATTRIAESYVVVYDPNGGFVTGGGWVDSPAGAYIADPALTGKATFGFVSKYLKGTTVPFGQTEFQFKMADLNFHSESYEWLVVAGAKAMYKGMGTINDEGSFKFLLSAIDADVKSNDDWNVDRFRIRIWTEDDAGVETVVYDNGLGADDTTDIAMTEIDGGSIVVHKAK